MKRKKRPVELQLKVFEVRVMHHYLILKKV